MKQNHYKAYVCKTKLFANLCLTLRILLKTKGFTYK